MRWEASEVASFQPSSFNLSHVCTAFWKCYKFMTSVSSSFVAERKEMFYRTELFAKYYQGVLLFYKRRKKQSTWHETLRKEHKWLQTGILTLVEKNLTFTSSASTGQFFKVITMLSLSVSCWHCHINKYSKILIIWPPLGLKKIGLNP